MDKIIELVKKGAPIYLKPYKEPKVWGIGGVGEYWYGADDAEKSSIAVVQDREANFAELVKKIPEEIVGKNVMKKKGRVFPLTKILTPKGRLSVQFHDAKSELWVVTGVNVSLAREKPFVIMGFNHEAIEKYGSRVGSKYYDSLVEFGKTLNELIDDLEIKGYADILKEKGNVAAAAKGIKDTDKSIFGIFDKFCSAEEKLDRFYNYVNVGVGDVLAVPQGTLHAIGAGVEVLEPQIPGPTQPLEDGATYPVRYYFPDHPRRGAEKKLDINRFGEINPLAWEMTAPMVLRKTQVLSVEHLPGAFKSKGLEVHRVTSFDKTEVAYKEVESCHVLALISGLASVESAGKEYDVPKVSANGRMLLVPASAAVFTVRMEPKSQFIDIFIPVT